MTDLFENFQGADIDRLTDCLQAIRKAGLKVDRHTMAGVNQNSGNVWVWSEDWAGAVACSIGFDVFWVYNCPECGEEHEFQTYDALDQYERAHSGQCESCVEVTACES